MKTKRSDQAKGGILSLTDLEILKKYKFESPLLITEHEFIELGSEHWESGSALVKYLADQKSFQRPIGELKGIVIPLELKGSNMVRQAAHGVELLTWLRWSASESLRCVPVLVTAFQPLESVLRRKLNLLLVARGTQYFRLPDSLERDRLVAFKDAVRGAKSSELCANAYDLDRMAGTASGTPPGVTYHDLANHYYAAHRLWEGYKAALGEALIINEPARAKEIKEQFAWNGEIAELLELIKDPSMTQYIESKKNTSPIINELARTIETESEFEWNGELAKLKNRPDVKQYLASAKQGFGSPGYPIVDPAKQVILRHVKNGLPHKSRILLVDDEFDQGLADVLLGILFKDAKFNFKNKNNTEWVYSDTTDTDKPWARLVCVRSADLAAHWLSYWGDINKRDRDDEWVFCLGENEWLSQWSEEHNQNEQENAEEVLLNIDYRPSSGNIKAQLAAKEASVKRNKRTVVLLDLRLETNEQKGSYKPEMLKSMQLRKLIKLNRKAAPVIMLTASRQAMNYAMVMEDAERADGWLTKEGPDINLDPQNSAQSVHYLLRRFHREPVGWYRDDMKWNDELWYSYYDFRKNPDWHSLQVEIETAASTCYQAAMNEYNDEVYKATPFSAWAKKYFNFTNEVSNILACRLFAFGMLFATGNIENEKYSNNLTAFNSRIPGCSFITRKVVHSIKDVVNFDRDLGSSYRFLDKGLLLREEYVWLRKQFKDDNLKANFLDKIISGIPAIPELQ